MVSHICCYIAALDEFLFWFKLLQLKINVNYLLVLKLIEVRLHFLIGISFDTELCWQKTCELRKVSPIADKNHFLNRNKSELSNLKTIQNNLIGYNYLFFDWLYIICIVPAQIFLLNRVYAWERMVPIYCYLEKSMVRIILYCFLNVLLGMHLNLVPKIFWDV